MALATWLRARPPMSTDACGVNRPAARAFATSSVRRLSDGPCGVLRSSSSYGMTTCAMKSRVRCCSSRSEGERVKSMVLEAFALGDVVGKFEYAIGQRAEGRVARVV